MSLWQFVALLGAHWVADFILQTRWEAENKSRRHDALAAHVATYTVALAIASVILFGGRGGVPYAVVNGGLHYGTDYLTSRWTARLYARKDWYAFFAVIGFDQLIHQVTLAATGWAML